MRRIFDRLYRTSLPDGFADLALDPYNVRRSKECPQIGVLDADDGLIISMSRDGLFQFRLAYEDVVDNPGAG